MLYFLGVYLLTNDIKARKYGMHKVEVCVLGALTSMDCTRQAHKNPHNNRVLLNNAK